MIQSPNQLIKCLPKMKEQEKSYYESLALNVKNKIEDNSEIYIIAQNSVGECQFFIKYYLDTATVNLTDFNLPIYENEDYNYKEYFDKEIKEKMLQYDYVFLANIDENFIKHYSFIFDNNEIINSNLYKITNSNGDIHLELIN